MANQIFFKLIHRFDSVNDKGFYFLSLMLSVKHFLGSLNLTGNKSNQKKIR